MIRKSILKSIEDDYITESDLLKKLDITHEHLKDHIVSLKETGYDIIHDESKGYKLLNTPDILEPFEVKRGLKTEYIANNIHFYENLESTNDTAKKYVDNDAPEGTVIIAEKQTAGRSRKNTDWASPEGGIYMTIILRPDVTLVEASKLTIVAGVSIAKTLHDEFGIDVGIKWPNDLLIGDKKICGILTEAVSDFDKVKAVLLGIGVDVNVEKDDIPDNLQDIATSVKNEINAELKRAEILRVFFKIFEDMYNHFKEGNFKEIINEWRRLSTTTGNRVRVYKAGKAIDADAIGVNNEGALIVELDDGTLEKINSGECYILND